MGCEDEFNSLIVVWEISSVTGGVLDPNTNGIIPGMDVPENPRGASEGSEPISPCSRCLALMSLRQDQLCRHPVRGKAAVGMELGMRGDPVLQDSGHSSTSLCQASSHLHGINAVVAAA